MFAATISASQMSVIGHIVYYFVVVLVMNVHVCVAERFQL
jgi:hypothetical protein